VRDLGQAVAAGGLVNVDDRHDNGALHPGADACLLQVVRGGDEELGGRLLLGDGPVAAFGENLADAPPESSGRPGNCDLHDVLLHEGVWSLP